MAMTIGERYKMKRLALGMTQADFADLCGVSTATISKFERGIFLSDEVFYRIKDTVEAYIRGLEGVEYYRIRIIESALSLDELDDDQKLRSLAHMITHASKFQMDLLREKNANK